LLLLFNFALEFTIKKDQEDKEKFELKATHDILVFANDAN